MQKKGLVSHIIKNQTKYFKASDPQRLLVYLKEKQDALQEQESKLKTIIPELEIQQQLRISEETAQVYDGLKGVQTARERSLRILKSGDEMWIIGIAKTPYDRLTAYFKEFHTRRSKQGITCNYLYNEYARKPFGESSAQFPHSEVRYMPEGIITHAWMEIYGDTVTIGINKGKSFSVVIQNQDVANSFKIYAQLLWGMAKK